MDDPVATSDLKNDLDLEAYTPYLLNRAGVRVANAFSQELKRFDISLQMWRVLVALWHSGGLRLSDLAGVTSIEISTLSRIVGGLQRKALVNRQRGDRDAREVQLALAPDGRAMTEKIIPLAVAYEARLITGLSPSEVATLKRLLLKLFDNMADDTRD